ncbi:MAG: isopenicillin N synthase family oxygenase, partial [Gammaproteobacteria bacterium]|nr:isopenicillin N synthase family oxygenase [Gammaproteobacteria bacterium]
MLALPVIDARGFRADPASPAGRRFVRALRDACHGPGFCYLVGHGVAPRLDAAIMAGAARFFALPEAERHRIAIGNSPHFRGYTVLGDERTQGKSDWREQIDIGPEEPALRLRPGDPAYLRLRGPNQWPDDSYHLRTAAEEWMRAMHDVGLCVMRALALGLGQPADQFDDAILPRPYPRLKIIRYPAQEAAHEDDQGVGLHHDSGLLSFILQDDVGGLQVQTES